MEFGKVMGMEEEIKKLQDWQNRALVLLREVVANGEEASKLIVEIGGKVESAEKKRAEYFEKLALEYVYLRQTNSVVCKASDDFRSTLKDNKEGE